MPMIQELTSVQELENALTESLEMPVILYCWASWCKPCKAFKPQFHDMVAVNGERIRFYMANVDELADELLDMNVLKVPTILRFDGKKETGRVEGTNREDVEQLIRFTN